MESRKAAIVMGMGAAACWLWSAAPAAAGVDPLLYPETKPTASDGAINDFFGHSVAVSEDTLAIGACQDDDAGMDSGSVHVFERRGAQRFELPKLIGSDTLAGDAFGKFVAADGDTILVGAPQHDGSGAVYVFVREGAVWKEQARLTASDAAFGDQFGSFVAIDGETAVVGASLADDGVVDSGAAYVFVRDGTAWTEQAKLVASDAAATDGFGATVSLDGDSLLVSSSLDDDLGDFSGSAYLYSYGPNVTARLEEVGGQHRFDIVLGNGTRTSRDFEFAIWIELPGDRFPRVRHGCSGTPDHAATHRGV